jgi:hypothetical protein
VRMGRRQPGGRRGRVASSGIETRGTRPRTRRRNPSRRTRLAMHHRRRRMWVKIRLCPSHGRRRLHFSRGSTSISAPCTAACSLFVLLIEPLFDGDLIKYRIRKRRCMTIRLFCPSYGRRRSHSRRGSTSISAPCAAARSLFVLLIDSLLDADLI